MNFRPRDVAWFVVLPALLSVGRFAAADGDEAASPALRTAHDGKTATVFKGRRPLLRYRSAEVPRKPYVDQWFTPAGAQVLRDAPADHKHHHGLMFAVAVEGIDFWAEYEDSGRQRGGALRATSQSTSGGLARAGFAQQLDWVAAEGGQPLLVERRTVEILGGDDLPATLLRWQSRLSAGPGKDRVELGGSHYFGLGLRMVESMDKAGRFVNAAGKPGELVRGEERLTAARWCAYTAPVEGKPVTLALFDHPDNPRHPARMFTMPVPFAYLAATMNLWKEPLSIERERPLTLRYGAALWDGRVEAAEIERIYRRWLAAEEQIARQAAAKGRPNNSFPARRPKTEGRRETPPGKSASPLSAGAKK